jgi:hypothetical protein
VAQGNRPSAHVVYVDYGELAPVITGLVPELEQAVRADASAELPEAARELLSDTYQAVSAMMAKLGETDAAWIAADRAAFNAEALHAVGVTVELGYAVQALDLARGIDPRRLSAEREAHYSIDLAQAHAMRRQIGEALHCLEEAERLTPEQTRTHRVARAVARDLIRPSGSRPRPELRELAERFAVLPRPKRPRCAWLHLILECLASLDL